MVWVLEYEHYDGHWYEWQAFSDKMLAIAQLDFMNGKSLLAWRLREV